MILDVNLGPLTDTRLLAHIFLNQCTLLFHLHCDRSKVCSQKTKMYEDLQG